MDRKRLIHVVFGSTSDEEKVLLGLVRATKEFGVDVQVDYASADNTPEKVESIADLHNSHACNTMRGSAVFISGAGLSNVLTGVLKSVSGAYDLNIGIPISDSSSDGLTSLLSTSEKPPRNPVLTVGMNNSYAAVSIANRFMDGLGHVSVWEDPVIRRMVGEDSFAGLKKAFDSYDMLYPAKTLEEISPDDVVVKIFTPNHYGLWIADELVSKGKGVVVGVSGMPIKDYCPRTYAQTQFPAYKPLSDRTMTATGIVSSRGYDNAVMMAAILTRDYAVIDKIAKTRKEKADLLRKHKGLLISNGEVTKL